MRKEFNELIDNLENFSAIDDDWVGMALDKLSKKIYEVEKRLECVAKTNKDIQKGVYKINEISHSGFGSTIDSILHDEILRGAYDIAIAVNLNDNEPIDENWYGLFEKPKSEADKLVERVEMIENDSELTTKFRKIYATDFNVIKACIRENIVKKKAIKFIKQLTKNYKG